MSTTPRPLPSLRTYVRHAARTSAYAVARISGDTDELPMPESVS
jgi:hypothetical protein